MVEKLTQRDSTSNDDKTACDAQPSSPDGQLSPDRQLSPDELHARYIEQQRRLQCNGCGEEGEVF